MLLKKLKHKFAEQPFCYTRQKHYLIVVLILNITIPSTESFAQKWSVFSTPHGLAGEGVNDILVDRHGEIWFATDNGVSRYNGEWINHRSRNGLLLINNFVTSIAQDDEGMIWFGTLGGISKIDPDPSIDLEQPANWHNYTVATTDSGLASDRIKTILIDREGKIWFATEGHGISVADPMPDMNDPSKDPLRNRENWMTFTRQNGLRSDRIQDMEMDAVGNIWVANGFASRGAINIYEWANRQWTTFDLQDRFANESVIVMFRDKSANMWIGTAGHGVYRVYPNNLATFDERYTKTNTKDGLAQNDIIAIAQDYEGAMWFGHTSRGVSMAIPDSDLADSSNWRNFDVRDGLSANGVAVIVEDTEENLWFGHTENGVTQLDRTWISFLTQSDSRANFVNGLFPDKQRGLWVATNGGAVRFNLDGNLLLEKNRFKITKSNSDLPSDSVTFVFQDSRNFFWFGTTNNGAGRVNVDSLLVVAWWSYKMPINPIDNGLVSNQIKWIAEDHLGYIWIATDLGLHRARVDVIIPANFYDNLDTVTSKDGLAANQILAIHRDKNDHLWFATNGGGISFFDPALNPKDPSNWINYNTSDGLVDDRVQAIYEDLNGNLWFATQGGVSMVDPRMLPNWKSYQANGLASNFVYSIAQFKEDEFWFGTAVGASRFKINDKINPWTTFTTLDGLPNDNVRALFTDTLRKEIWFGTVGGGVVRYRPKRQPPKTVIDTSTRFDLVTENRVKFSFHGADIITPAHQLRYQYRLDNEGWRETSDRSAVVFVRDSDKPERHVFYVRAIDRDGNIEPMPASNVFYKIDSRLGGSVEITDADKRVRLYVPPGVLTADTAIAITPAKVLALPDTAFVIVAYDIAPQSLQMPKPATLAISFPNAKGYDSNQLAVFQQDGSKWIGLGGTVTNSDNMMTITTAIKELGTFAVRNTRVTRSDLAIAEVNIQPRVFSPTGDGIGHGDRANISFSLQDDAIVSVKVYDLAGRLKRVIEENISLLAGTNVVEWDGRDDDGRFCVSGLYVVTIEALGRVQTKTVMVANRYK